MEAHVVTAPGDGVAPAVLLSLPAATCAVSGHQRVQYLFNVPEGFSRLVLEHKLRPGAGLRAAFACDVGSLAGFGGLAMRLRGEGHGQVHVVGPPGTQAAVCSLRHFIHWRHPAVLLEEVAPWDAKATVYQDDQIAVAALWKPPLVADLWPAPPWLHHEQPLQPAKPAGGQCAVTSDSSAESSSSDNNGSSSSSDGPGSSACSASSEDSDTEQQREQQAAPRPPSGASMFDALDRLFMEGSGGRRLALDHLRQATAAPGSTAAAVSLVAMAGATQQPATAAAGAAVAAAKAAVACVAPSRRRQPAAAAAAAVAEQEEVNVAFVGGKRYQRLPDPAGINVWVCQKVAMKAAAAQQAPGNSACAVGTPDHAQAGRQQAPQQRQQVLGFVCHLKASDQLLLLSNLHSRSAAAQLQQHPALALLLQQRGRVAGVLHLAAPGVAGSKALRQLCQQMQPAAATSGGQQLLLEQPGPHSSQQVIGHLAAARTTAKLNLIGSHFFPLPAGVRAPPTALEATAALVAGEVAAVAAAEPSAQGLLGSSAAAAPSSSTPGPDGLEQQRAGGSGQQVQEVQEVQEAQPHEVEEPSGVASSNTAGGATSAAIAGLVHVRHVSVVRWQQPAAASAAAAAEPLQPQLVLESGEGFTAAAGFDAAAVQQEVQEQRQGLLEQLEHLLQCQQQGLLPGPAQLAAAGAVALQCRQNRVAPPPPPPQPPQPAVFVPPAFSHAPVGPNGRAFQQQQPPPPSQQQQPPPLQQQQSRVMRPLYQVPGAAYPAQQLQLPARQWQLHGAMQPPPPPLPTHGGPQPWAAGGPAAAMRAAQQQSQQPQHEEEHPLARAAEPAPQNKRAAEVLKAQLQGNKRPRQQDGVAGIEGGPAGAQPQQQPQAEQSEQPFAGQAQARGQQQGQWLEGAPPSICQLAARSSSAAGPEVLFLGTGSAEPSKYRAASAIQLRLSCGQSLLVDCGEGALGALCRSYGTATALRQVASLGCLWVSHRHADHMSGVLPLLAAYPASLPPLLVVGPHSLRGWLAEAAPPLGLAGRYHFVHCAEMNQPGHWARQALQRHLGICHMQCVPVRHCSDAYGLIVRHQEGWSLVYSGDTQPCQQLVQAGQGCTLLIHEATFEPCLQQQARQKRHSTTAEALEVAQRMGAYRCILTHFSQRYPKWPEGMPQGHQEGSAASAAAAVAFDGMRVPLKLLPILPALMPAVQAALADVEEVEAAEEGAAEKAPAAN